MKKHLKTIRKAKDKAKEPSNTRNMKYRREKVDTEYEEHSQGARGEQNSLGHKICTLTNYEQIQCIRKFALHLLKVLDSFS
jgi:hypothetical protein